MTEKKENITTVIHNAKIVRIDPRIDKNVVAVRDMLWERMEKGYNKYNTNTERSDLSILDWLQHLQEELLDAAVYVQTLKNNLKDESK